MTEGLKQILGSVYDGDPEPLKGLVENAADATRSTSANRIAR